MVVLQVSYSQGDGFHVLEKEKQTNLNKFQILIQHHRACVYSMLTSQGLLWCEMIFYQSFHEAFAAFLLLNFLPPF